MSNKKTTPAPVAAVEPVEAVAADVFLDAPVEVPVAPVKAGKTYVAVDGDTYASIADRFKPAGMTKHEYAVHLTVLNGSNLQVGAEVQL